MNLDWETIKYIFWTVLPLLGLLSFINALLGLKERLQKQLAPTSSKLFNNRLELLGYRFRLIEDSRCSNLMLIRLLRDFLLASSFFVFSIMCLIMSHLTYLGELNISKGDFKFPISTIIAYAGFFFASFSLTFFSSSYKFANRVIHPTVLAEEIIQLINKGKAKGYLEKDDNVLANKVLESEMFTEIGRETLSKLANIEYVKKIPTNSNHE